MGQTITIRLTPKREKLLTGLKKRFKVNKNSEAIDLALKMGSTDGIDYRTRIEQVSGCISLKGKRNAVKRIRSMRDVK
ncbi:MAG: hypothetical protein NTZ51_01215 [Proteobacteria bacterium]|nr:hypothetical protein [Pseudomonadota bacterium]